MKLNNCKNKDASVTYIKFDNIDKYELMEQITVDQINSWINPILIHAIEFL